MKPNPNTLRHLENAIVECKKVHSDAEVREAAKYLNLEHMLPEIRQERLTGLGS